MTDTKQCTKCQKNKPCSAFHKNSRNPDKLANQCKDCVKQANDERAAARVVVAPETLIECNTCHQRKPAAESFYPHPTSRTGYNTSKCRDCLGRRQKKYPSTPDPEAQRAYQLMRNYGVTVEWYDEQLVAQDGGCAICQATEPGNGWKFFAVDHSHRTGKVRKLLCAACNWMLGHAGDDPERLEAGAKYLRDHA